MSGRDSLIAFCYQALLQLKGQFLIYTYGWTSTELGPYMTLMGVCRGLVLVVLLPCQSSILHIKPPGANTVSFTQWSSSYSSLV